MDSSNQQETGATASRRISFLLLLLAVLAFGGIAGWQLFGGSHSGSGGSSNGNNIAGQWSGTMYNISLHFTFYSAGPTGQYGLDFEGPAITSGQSGTYRLVPPNTIAFTVTGWEPTAMTVYHVTGPSTGFNTQDPVPKPSDATDTYVFNDPNTMTLTDQATNGSVTLYKEPIVCCR